MDDAIREATRLLASLRSMRATQVIVDEAELLLSALKHDSNRHVLNSAIEALERIDGQMPQGALAGLVSVRLRTLAGMIAAMQDSTPTPPPAA
ncbi:MAG: hypothetical protein ACTH3D_12610 [Halomonas sp.]|uniref:hypothetical protein n=1 Tax=Halomonas sp. TaxID=1486246 RepID=UPI003F904F2C